MEKRLASCLVFLTVAGKGKEMKMDKQLKWKCMITMEWYVNPNQVSM